jgi:transcriptional regulator GlxA family with amidase domain
MRRVVFLAVPPVQILDLTGPFEVFARCGGYQVELYTTDPRGRVTASCGLTIANAQHYSTVRGSIDTIMVPGGTGTEEGLCDRKFLQWLARASKRTRRTCSVCTGSFLLAAAGILDGRRSATHWDWCGLMAEMFPKVRVEQDPIYIKDGSIYTSAGVTAGLDLALALVEEDHGRERARKIAQDLVMFLRRSGGQSQFSTLLSAQACAHKPIEDVAAWMIDHLDGDLSIERLADRCGMSPRHFARVFVQEKGTTPARYVEKLRVSAARALLQDSKIAVKVAAVRTGFNSADSMRRAFRRVLAVSPRTTSAASGN